MTTYNQIAATIIKEQEALMGSVAWSEAGKVPGLTIGQVAGEISIDESRDQRAIIDNLVGQYENLFGLAARKVCKESVTALVADLSEEQVPTSLQ